MSSHDPGDNRRQARRYRAQHLAKIVVNPDTMITCMVEEISTDGARISIDSRYHVPDDFDLFIAAHELQVHRARLCWREEGMIGVAFIHSLDRQDQARPIAQAGETTRSEAERLRVEIEREGRGAPAIRLRPFR
ncbi:MAG TPA: PilZ domain-containing protein [Microvirga sp.]|nr:PilZ domain-containing protein [Microvirga sp.]